MSPYRIPFPRPADPEVVAWKRFRMRQRIAAVMTVAWLPAVIALGAWLEAAGDSLSLVVPFAFLYWLCIWSCAFACVPATRQSGHGACSHNHPWLRENLHRSVPP